MTRRMCPIVAAAVFFLTAALGDSVVPAAAENPLNTETIEMELLRTVHAGRTFGRSKAQLSNYVLGKGLEFDSYVLGRSALAAAGDKNCGTGVPLAALLDRLLGDQMINPQKVSFASQLPDGFMNYHLVFTLVQAMVLSGEQEQAIEALRKQLAGGSDYKINVVLHALRLIGGDKATNVITEYGSKQEDSYNIILHNLLAESFFPIYSELPERLEKLPKDSRTSRNLTGRIAAKYTVWRELESALGGASAGEPAQSAPVAAYLLGFFPGGRPDEAAELDALRLAANSKEFYTRHFGLKSLALRSKESIPYWIDRYHEELSEWTQGMIVTIGFIHFGAEFIAPAQRLLQENPHQYIQWEIVWGILNQYRGSGKRTIWDLWYPTTLQARIDFAPQYEKEKRIGWENVQSLLAWLEESKWNGQPGVMHQLYYYLALGAGPQEVKPLLRLFDRRSDKLQMIWILNFLQFPETLAYLRAWNETETDLTAKEQLQASITVIGQNLANQQAGAGANACCDATEACLRQQYAAAVIPDNIKNWLNQDDSTAGIQIEFINQAKREAVVNGPGSISKWIHIFGCWRKE